MIKRPDKEIFVDTVVFSAIVSKKYIYDEDFQNVKKKIRADFSKYWRESYTYINISKWELEGKTTNSTFRKIAQKQAHEEYHIDCKEFSNFYYLKI